MNFGSMTSKEIQEYINSKKESLEKKVRKSDGFDSRWKKREKLIQKAHWFEKTDWAINDKKTRTYKTIINLMELLSGRKLETALSAFENVDVEFIVTKLKSFPEWDGTQMVEK